MKKIAFIFPGQGSQYVGMGKDFFDNFEIAKNTFLEGSEILGYDITDIIFNGPSEKLNLTKYSQVAIFINSVAILRVLTELFPMTPVACGGLSLGEYTALFASNRISFKDALLLVQKRAESMSEACLQTKGTMAAVLGLDNQKVQEIVDTIEDVWVANLNCPNQVVISGTKEGIDKATNLLKENKAKRIVPLQVEGAFHSPLMLLAEKKLKNAVDEVTLSSSDIDFIMNYPGDFVKSDQDIKKNLIKQLTNSVRYEECIRKIDAKNIDLFLEMGSGTTLFGINKKIKPKAKTISIGKLSDLHAFIDGEKHA